MKYENRNKAFVLTREIEILEHQQKYISSIEEIKFGDKCSDLIISLEKRSKDSLTILANTFIDELLNHIEKQIEEKKNQLAEL